jgi:hypothetical protein
MFGNVAGIVTPIVIGYLVAKTGSFNGALVFVGINALLTVFSYLVIVERYQARRTAPELIAQRLSYFSADGE